MTAPLHIFILAAGFGTRLKPLSEVVPKPLVPVADMTALEHQLRCLKALRAEFDVASLHINAHHLYSQVEAEAQNLGLDQVWVEWPKILGTGAPLHRLWQSGLRGELLVLNADNFHNLDLAEFVRQSRSSQRSFSLLGVDFPAINSLSLNAEGHLCGVGGAFEPLDDVAQNSTFSGIAWYGENAWSQVQSDDFSIVNFWQRAVQKQQAPWVYQASTDSLWIDMGTPLGLYRASVARLKELDLWQYVAPQVDLKGVDLQGHCVVGAGAQVAAGSSLENCIVLPQTQISSPQNLKNCIVGEGFVWNLEL
ncbi:MAG: NTP transferase domain-containing protein [Fibrobacter sp.]|nr:NTP transferase domain-containing protein [Fibrobacter sp.]